MPAMLALVLAPSYALILLDLRAHCHHDSLRESLTIHVIPGSDPG